MIGVTLNNNYKVIDVLGSGTFGKVLLAYDELADHNVAIKTFVNHNFSHSDIIRELQFLASLKHPNIVTFYHHFFQNDNLNIVMEYCANGTLSDQLTCGKYETDEAINVVIKLLEALEFIHQKNIIHRDIKPTNVLFDENLSPKLSDFGVSNTGGGTLLYLPPVNNLDNSYSNNDVRTDIYSLGLVFLEMLLGDNPFNNLTNDEIHNSKLNQLYINQSLPYWLQEVVLKATHPQPEFRFQSAREFISALQSRSVPYKINSDNIKADRFFEFAKRLLNQKHWTKSKKFIDKGLELYPESALGNIISGQYYVKTNQLKVAKGYLDKAISLNLGVNIKKELAEILIDEGNYPQANSLLQSHIQLNPSDWEAYNLLSESYYLMNRFELSIEILSIVIKSASKDCFWNNLLIAHLNNESLTPDFVSLAIGKTNSHSFINYNKLVYLDKDKSWTTTNQKKDKYLYQSYRFNNYKKQNQLQITVGKTVNVYSKPIISIGRNKENDLILNDNSVSRRHSVIINYFDDVWIYDMGSTQGTYVDGQQITRKFFLQGEHKLKVGEKLLTIKTDIYKII